MATLLNLGCGRVALSVALIAAVLSGVAVDSSDSMVPGCPTARVQVPNSVTMVLGGPGSTSRSTSTERLLDRYEFLSHFVGPQTMSCAFRSRRHYLT